MANITLSRLTECEQIIERGLNTFVEVGNALLEIRDSRLYRDSHSTFEAYCQERWGMERRNAYRLIDAANVVQSVSNWTQILPTNEAQARPLTGLSPEEMTSAWQQVVDKSPNGKITAKLVEEVVENLRSPHVSHNSGENEWYTPPEYIKAATAVMGRIDLDPASSKKANDTVKASKYYSKQDDGLSKVWAGKVWMNPPYASGLIRLFVGKFVSHVDNGDIKEGIVLVNNATETNWFNELISVASAAVFPSGRVKFLDADGNQGAPLQGQAIVYIGNNCQKFFKEFKEFGWQAYVQSR